MVLLPVLLMANEGGWAIAALIFLAVAFFTPSGLLVVLGQGYLPNRIGIASGVTLGLAVSVGGMVAPALGVLADRQGVASVLLVVEVVLSAAVLVSFLLPKAPRPPVHGPDVNELQEGRVPVPAASESS
jgi:FSR family fosmidomycin resistance protein-like MFS transporter